MSRKGPRILLIGGTYRALCVLERLLERGERVAAFLGQEREGERDFCSEILEVCDRASVPARSGRKLGEEMVRWLEDRIRPDLAIAVGVSGEVPLPVGGNCRLGLVELVDLFQSEKCPGVVLRQRGQEVVVRRIEKPERPEEREEVYLEVIDTHLSAIDEFLDDIESSASTADDEVRFDPAPLPFEDMNQLVEFPKPGPTTARFEEAVARYVEADRVFAVTSATEALTEIFTGLEIGDGDDVICPGIVSGAVVDALRKVGARPVWVDVEPDRLTLEPRRVPEGVTPRTRAMVVSHAFGQPADLDALYRVAEEHGLEVVEDGGGSLGARLGTSRLGRSPRTCVFRMSAQEAGGDPSIALVTLPMRLTPRFARRLEPLRVGDGLASLTERVLANWEDVLSRRREIAREYSATLAPYDAFRVPATIDGALSAYPLFLLQLTRFARSTAEDLHKLLRESGVETPRLAARASERELVRLPVTEEVHASSILLPIRPDLSDAERERTLDAIFDFAIG
jgi:dTDP-4-amino-4,6-dideoxygalactose transaminase